MASNEVFCMHGFAMKYDTKPVAERENTIHCIIMIHPIALDVQFFLYTHPMVYRSGSQHGMHVPLMVRDQSQGVLKGVQFWHNS
jgi:hypothetical protein